jgi:hypothetical protein
VTGDEADFAGLIEKLKALPDEKLAEARRFVEFLSAGSPRDLEPSATDYSQFALWQALRGAEHDPVVYTADDNRRHRR